MPTKLADESQSLLPKTTANPAKSSSSAVVVSSKKESSRAFTVRDVTTNILSFLDKEDLLCVIYTLNEAMLEKQKPMSIKCLCCMDCIVVFFQNQERQPLRQRHR